MAKLGFVSVGVAVVLSKTAEPGLTEFCADQQAKHGCCQACGFEAVGTSGRVLCMPSSKPRAQLPFRLDEEGRTEFCQLVARNHGCSDVCGYTYDTVLGKCTQEVPMKATGKLSADPIIGGYGDFRYQYMPDLMKGPAGASLTNCHGLVTDEDGNIYLTYQNDGVDKNCLLKFNPDGTNGQFMTGGGTALCDGTPHGLKIRNEGGKMFLYHSNNDQKLTKTTLDGTIVWQVNGQFGQDPTIPYRPTWFATPDDSDFMYLCDGYGSNNVYSFSLDGKFTNNTWGGHSKAPNSPDAEHGKFSTNHGCTYESRPQFKNMIVVSDRANSRLEYFQYDPKTGNKFEYANITVNLQPSMGPGTLPCNIRMYPNQQGRAIIPDLAGPVAVLDNNNQVISVVNVSVLLAADQHNHPHDAIFLPNGDMVVATWAPGRLSYWKLLPKPQAPQ